MLTHRPIGPGSAAASRMLAFGLRQSDGRMITPEEAGHGAQCGCICPACGAALVAKKGSVRVHHFAHARDSNCTAGGETAIHRMAKQILLERAEIVLPPVVVPTAEGPLALAPARRVQLRNVILEAEYGGIRPDVQAKTDDGPLLIEVLVTHSVDAEKRQRIASLGVAAIEVDLSRVPRGVSKKVLESCVIAGAANRRWIWTAQAGAFRSEQSTAVLRFGRIAGSEPTRILAAEESPDTAGSCVCAECSEPLFKASLAGKTVFLHPDCHNPACSTKDGIRWKQRETDRILQSGARLYLPPVAVTDGSGKTVLKVRNAQALPLDNIMAGTWDSNAMLKVSATAGSRAMEIWFAASESRTCAMESNSEGPDVLLVSLAKIPVGSGNVADIISGKSADAAWLRNREAELWTERLRRISRRPQTEKCPLHARTKCEECRWYAGSDENAPLCARGVLRDMTLPELGRVWRKYQRIFGA